MPKTLVGILNERFKPRAFDENNLRRFENNPEIVDTINKLNDEVSKGVSAKEATTILLTYYNFFDGYKDVTNLDDFMPLINFAWTYSEQNKKSIDWSAEARYATDYLKEMLDLGYDKQDFTKLWSFNIKEIESGEPFSNFINGIKLLPNALEIGMEKAEFIKRLKETVLDSSFPEFKLDIETKYAEKTGSELPPEIKLKNSLEEKGLSAYADDFKFDSFRPEFVFTRLKAYDKLHEATGWGYETLKPLIVGDIFDSRGWQQVETGLKLYKEGMNQNSVVSAALSRLNYYWRSQPNFKERMENYGELIKIVSSNLADALFEKMIDTPSKETVDCLKTIGSYPTAQQGLVDYIRRGNIYEIITRKESSFSQGIEILSELLKEGYKVEKDVVGNLFSSDTYNLKRLNTKTIATVYLGLQKPA